MMEKLYFSCSEARNEAISGANNFFFKQGLGGMHSFRVYVVQKIAHLGP